MTDLRDRIASAIARKTAAKAPDEVLAEIERDHLILRKVEPPVLEYGDTVHPVECGCGEKFEINDRYPEQCFKCGRAYLLVVRVEEVEWGRD